MRWKMMAAVLGVAALAACQTDGETHHRGGHYRQGDIPPGAPGGLTGDRQILSPDIDRACRFYGPPRSQPYEECRFAREQELQRAQPRRH
jgi:hypothetical protein